MKLPFSLHLIACLIFARVVLAEDKKKLLFAQVLFRHGARAPSAGLTDSRLEEYFPRGLGALTDRGYENSYKVGRFLAERYVKSGFLDENMKPREMYWRSVNINRCLATAATVGAAMFADAHKHLHPPITTEETDETLLNYDISTCFREQEVYEKMCPGYLRRSFKTWPQFEAFIADCLNITQDPIFQQISFSNMEAHINEYKNGIPLPELLENNKEKVFRLYTQTIHKIIGVGAYQNLDLMRIKFGNLVRTLQENMRKAWSCYQKGEKCSKNMNKMKFYSTQDWILMGILESFGVLNVTTAHEMPEYNTMIILELWSNKNIPEIKLLYKKEEVATDLLDVTKYVRNCEGDSESCSLEDFLSCCAQFWNDGTACASKNSESSAAPFKKRHKRYVYSGPE